ncbi:MAG TPA: hypothetical protein ENH41_05835 [Candidatus Omnitrophica bacterium]|nr:hypothetical protein [Candidatus Omnitrophota bacterium]
MKEKPVFCKILGKDETQPQIVHLGFNREIESYPGGIEEFKEHFVNLCVRERELVKKLKKELKKYIKTKKEFEQYSQAYAEWVREQILKQWKRNTLPQLPNFLQGINIKIFKDIIKNRQEIVGYLNEIELEPGRVILAPVGYIHSIVGSHQGHPFVEPHAKNEA